MGTNHSLSTVASISTSKVEMQPTYRIFNNFTEQEFDAGSLTDPVVGADYLLDKRT